VRIPRKRSIDIRTFATSHALLSNSTEFGHRPRSFGKVIFLSILYAQNLLHTYVLLKAMFQRILVDLSWLLRVCET
jgi:hypothetical protein